MVSESEAGRSSHNRDKWYLRTEDGTVFGPVSENELREWAEQGRIVPGCSVSSDKLSWTPAEDQPFLHMDWFVRLPSGETYGPLNIKALADLLADGSIGSDTQLEHRTTGELTSVAAKQEEILGHAVISGVAKEERTRLEQEKAAQAKQLEDLNRRVAELEERLATTVGEMEKLRQGAQEERAKYEQALASNEEQTAQLRTDLARLQEERERIFQELSEAWEQLTAAAEQAQEREIDWLHAG
ncbi:MAG: hypothetical protein ACUVWX_07245, partial [Kiritimatiellia bacterium]